MRKFFLLAIFLLAHLAAFAQQNLLNASFEDTLLVANDTVARHWSTSAFGAGLTTDASSGSYAAYIWNWYYYGEGLLVNGSLTQPGMDGSPINFSPNALSGSYKYILDGTSTSGDSAVVYVYLTKYNTTTQQRDTVGSGTMLFGAQGSYTPFQVAINYNSTVQADTISIRFQSSINGFCDQSTDGNCLFFYVDDLALINSISGISTAVALNPSALYPNPADEVVFIHNAAAERVMAKIYASDGRLLQSLSVAANDKQRLDISELEAGLYFVKVGEQLFKLVKK